MTTAKFYAVHRKMTIQNIKHIYFYKLFVLISLYLCFSNYLISKNYIMKNVIKKLFAFVALIGVSISQIFATTSNDHKRILVNSSKGSITIEVSSIISYIEVGTHPDDLWNKIIYKKKGESLDEINLLNLNNDAYRYFQILEVSNDFEEVTTKMKQKNISYADYFIKIEEFESSMGYHKTLINRKYKEILVQQTKSQRLYKNHQTSSNVNSSDGYNYTNSKYDNNLNQKLQFAHANGINFSEADIEDIQKMTNTEFKQREFLARYTSRINNSTSPALTGGILFNLTRLLAVIGGFLIKLGGVVGSVCLLGTGIAGLLE